MEQDLMNIANLRFTDKEERDENCKGESSCSLGINELPPEILDKIFCFLNLEELCRTISLVCKKWYQLVQNPIHWKIINPKNMLSVEQLDVLIMKAPLLVDIDLSNQKEISDECLLLLTQSCPYLQRMNLGFCDKNSIGKMDYKWLHNCHNVKFLDVQGSSTWVTDKFISCLNLVPKLTGLNALYCHHFTDSCLELLADKAPNLAFLHLDGVEYITDSGLCKFILQIGHQLTLLTIDGEKLTDRSLLTITKNCSQLQTFQVSFASGFTSDAVVQLKRLNMLKNLKLRRANNVISTAWHLLFHSPGMSSLEYLQLEECETLKDNGVCQIAKCCGAKIRFLDLSWCYYVTDVGVSAIVESCRKLEYLTLVGLKDITEVSLRSIPEIQPLKYLDLTQCDLIEDDTIREIVETKNNIVIYNYYGEEFCSVNH